MNSATKILFGYMDLWGCDLGSVSMTRFRELGSLASTQRLPWSHLFPWGVLLAKSLQIVGLPSKYAIPKIYTPKKQVELVWPPLKTPVHPKL